MAGSVSNWTKRAGSWSVKSSARSVVVIGNVIVIVFCLFLAYIGLTPGEASDHASRAMFLAAPAALVALLFAFRAIRASAQWRDEEYLFDRETARLTIRQARHLGLPRQRTQSFRFSDIQSVAVEQNGGDDYGNPYWILVAQLGGGHRVEMPLITPLVEGIPVTRDVAASDAAALRTFIAIPERIEVRA